MTPKTSRTPARNARIPSLLSPLYGAACGDALGTTLEFQNLPALPWDFSARYAHTTITGRGPFGVAKGQITDDTMMACAMAGSITAESAYSPAAVAAAYAEWRRHTFDIGGTTSAACSAHAQGAGRPGYDPLRAVPRATTSAANGALMRATPLAVWHCTNRREVLRHAVWDALLSHTAPLCVLSNAAYCVAIAHLIATPRTEALTVVSLARLVSGAAKVARAAVRDAAELLRVRGESPFDVIATAERMVLEDLALGEADDPGLYGEKGDSVCVTGGSQGYVRVAFRLAWWEAFHARTYSEGVIDTVNRGGDADTTGAIVGGLLGAIFGIGGKRGIPEAWVATVATAKTRHGGECDATYHPRVFEAFVEAALAAPVRGAR